MDGDEYDEYGWKAYDKGYDDGYNEGYEDAMKEIKKKNNDDI